MSDTPRRPGDGSGRPSDDSSALLVQEQGGADPAVLRAPNRGPVGARPDDDAPAPGDAGGESTQRTASLLSDAWRQLRRSKIFVLSALLLLVLTVMAAFPQLFTSRDPRDCALTRSKGVPGADAWFGYDVFGCDYYSNVIYGARVSMIIGIVVVGGSLLIGVTLGALAGYFGGWFDILMSRLTDIAFGIPLLLGSILILGAFPERGLREVCIALIALGWMTILRLFRSSVVSIKDTDYVAAARAMGATNSRILLKHIVPNALAPVLVYSTIAVGGIIAAEATLSFLGIGLQLPAISWGLQIGTGQNLIRTAPHLVIFPSIFLSITVLSFILLGDALRDALDPKLR